MMTRRSLAIHAMLAFWACSVARAEDPPTPTVAFNRDVRPILAAACFRCHGPDKAQRKADLRLDIEEGARTVVEPGDPTASELLHRIRSDDPDEKMPPPDSGPGLAPEQIAMLTRWIEQGADWQPHWSLIKPMRPDPPTVRDDGWVKNPLDRFVLARLEREGLRPAPPADPVSLMRRVSLDLNGLPPTPSEVDAYLADDRPDAYERLVDRLLASPRYGERMAKRWLEAARYADTNGYQSDGERTMWRWRDWVIEAFNKNMPFDVFAVEQLAGDLLPEPTLDQLIATGFNRNHRGNAEGGIIPEEYAAEYVADRVETTATVWLGLTLGCARCHDHKYDPLTQTDFYRMFAFFNNVPERGRAVKFGNSPPMIPAPTREQQVGLAALDARLQAAEERFRALEPEIRAAQAEWEAGLCDLGPNGWTFTRDRLARLGFEDGIASEPVGADASAPGGGSPEFDAGPVGRAVSLDGRTALEYPSIGDFGFLDAFTLTAWVRPEDDRGGTILSRMKDEDRGEGYGVTLSGGKVGVHFVKRWLDDALRVEADTRLVPGRWQHLTVVYDGSRVADGVKVFVDGESAPVHALLDDLNQTFKTTEPFRVGGGGGPDARFHGRVDEVQVFSGALPPEAVAIVATPERPDEIARIPAGDRSARQAAKLRTAFLEAYAPEPIRDAARDLLGLREERARAIASFPTTMVMQERPAPRETHVLIRGQYDRPGARVGPGVPGSLPPLPADAPPNRLGLARWLVSPENPLTARVAVNGYWTMLFGTGLVKTAEDFGVQGEWPSHPDLLDWLAVEFVATGWDVKATLRTIVTSATYRQSSKASPGLLERDPENRLLARGPRFRLPAEMIRDQALLAGGLLVEKVGGASVRPYQPDGLWRELAEIKEYEQSRGPDLYRRSLYTFWKRTVAPPFLANFDEASRDRCVVSPSRTNTPLQALNLLNDVTFVEAARGLAQRVLLAEDLTAPDRLALAFRTATCRPPTVREQGILAANLHDHLDHYRSDPAAAKALVEQGDSPRDPSLDPSELAAYTAVCSLILNLDETLTKE